MLWTDKYRPRDFTQLNFNQYQSNELKNLTKDGDFPHLLIYGPLGAGKKTRIMCLLKELYGNGVERIKAEQQTFTTPSNKKLDITILTSNYHIEVNPSDVGINDRIVIMNIIKNVAQTQQLNQQQQRDFKVIVINDVENLTKDAQHALRRTMEKYIKNCRIILNTTSISRIIPAIRSRCLCIRMPAPKSDDIKTILKSIAIKEDTKVTNECIDRITQICDRNLRRAILMLEAAKIDSFDLEKIKEPDWQLFIRDIANKAIETQNIKTIIKIRAQLYDLISFGIPSEIIFRTLLEEIMKNCDNELINKIIEQAAIYEHRMIQGNKQIFHLEAFIVKFMCLYQNMMSELMVDDFNL